MHADERANERTHEECPALDMGEWKRSIVASKRPRSRGRQLATVTV